MKSRHERPASTASLRLEAEPACAATARRFAVGALSQWDLERFHQEVALCTTELATNAVLHSRRPFTVAVRPVARGVRIDLQDERPDLLPQLVPADIDPLATGTTGRGLRLVASLAARWGFFTTEVAKTVWVELEDGQGTVPSDPQVEIARQPGSTEGQRLRFIGLPVQAGLASGAQVDDLVRELQLQPDLLSPEETSVFYELLERSARPRLVGRQAAFQAAAEARDRFEVELMVSPAEVSAVAELGRFLDELTNRPVLTTTQVPQSVNAMRAWLVTEARAQLLQGRKPVPYDR